MTNSCTKLKRREGTAGISGHLYETKLLSLINFRATHEHTIEEFQLVPNVDNIGAFDDVCFKIKVEGLNKPIFVFIQAKHKENTQQRLKIDLSKFFISFINIRQEFDPSHKDWLFKGTFDEAECVFVIYTTARDPFSNGFETKSSYSCIVNELIGTGGSVKQPCIREDDVKSLCEVALKEQMTYLAKRIAKLIQDGKLHMLLTDEIVLRFHVILAQKVVDVSDIQRDGHRIALFRHEFFETHDEYLDIFKDTLFKEILKKRKMTTDTKRLLSEFLDDPTDATKLSQVIGTVVIYKKGVFEMNKQYTQYFTPQLNQVYVSLPTVYQATELAARQILLSPDFKLRVPASFGNKDLTLSRNIEKKQNRIKHLTTKITDLLDDCTSDKIVTINESLDGLLKLDGGLAGAIGNIFVLDDDTKLMKITDKSEKLETDAKQLYESLNEKIESINKIRSDENTRNRSNNKPLLNDLHEYKFSFKIKKFPQLLLECSEYEEQLAREFLNKLVIYSNQADEKNMEEKLKIEMIETLTLSDSDQAKIDDIFLKYHNAIQTWWMRPEESLVSSLYLTKTSEIFEKATNNIIEDPIISSLSAPYVRQMKRYNYTFIENAVKSLNLQDQQPSTIIVAKNSTLSIVKVLLHLNNKDYAALNIDQIVNLTKKKRKALIKELKTIKKEKVLIFVCDKIHEADKEKKVLETIADAVRNKKTIIITNHSSVEILQIYFDTADIVYDIKNSLIDMNEETQRRVLKSARVTFQGIEVGLEHLVSGWPKYT